MNKFLSTAATATVLACALLAAPAAPRAQEGVAGTTTTGLMASDLIGTDVQNAGGETIGEIDDVILGDGGLVEGVLVDVGGFLNVDERRVLLGWNELQIAVDGDEVTATASYTADQLEGLPAYESTSMN